MMGMSSPEWSRYMHDVIGLRGIAGGDQRRGRAADGGVYREQLPLIPGAVEAVERLAARWPLGLASSSNRELIDFVLDVSGLGRLFRATVSSEEVSARQAGAGRLPGGGPAAGRRPERCAAVEDSENGIRSAKSAGMRMIAIPNPGYPPAQDALAEADVVLDSVGLLTPEVV